MQKVLTSEKISIFYWDQDIVYTEFHIPLKATLEDAKVCLNVYEKLFNESKEPLLLMINVTNLKGISREARVYIAGEKMFATYIKAAVYLVENYFSSMVGNFIVRTVRQKYPRKVFSNKEKAIIWLKSFKKDV